MWWGAHVCKHADRSRHRPLPSEAAGEPGWNPPAHPRGSILKTQSPIITSPLFAPPPPLEYQRWNSKRGSARSFVHNTVFGFPAHVLRKNMFFHPPPPVPAREAALLPWQQLDKDRLGGSETVRGRLWFRLSGGEQQLHQNNELASRWRTNEARGQRRRGGQERPPYSTGRSGRSKGSLLSIRAVSSWVEFTTLRSRGCVYEKINKSRLCTD